VRAETRQFAYQDASKAFFTDCPRYAPVFEGCRVAKSGLQRSGPSFQSGQPCRFGNHRDRRDAGCSGRTRASAPGGYRHAARSGKTLNLTTSSAWPKRPGKAPPGIPVGGNEAIDAAFPLGLGLLRIEGAIAAGRHKILFPAQGICRFCRPDYEGRSVFSHRFGTTYGLADRRAGVGAWPGLRERRSGQSRYGATA
jgi:hypothetical protein